MKYLVEYMLGTKYYTGGQEPPVGNTRHSLTVDAEDRVGAFIAAYEQLTDQGHHVATWEFGNVFQRGSGEGNPLDFTDAEVDRVRDAGIPFDRSMGHGAHIESITPRR